MDELVWLDEMTEAQRWTVREQSFRIGDTSYLSTMAPVPDPSYLCVVKPPALVEKTVALARDYEGANIVELGIRHGGSTAMLTQIAIPKKLVAIELSTDPLDRLEAFLDVGDRREFVRPYFGVDQADRARLAQILDDEFGDEPIDLVIDDASHLPDETRASFEVVFPRLRPGGRFVLEDWNCDHVRAKGVKEAAAQPDSAGRKAFEELLKERLADPESEEYALFQRWARAHAENPDTAAAPETFVRPLTLLVLELSVARAWSGDVVSEVLLETFWATFGRGPADLDRDSFRVADIVHDRFGLLTEQPPR